jgi:hypothetical protein
MVQLESEQFKYDKKYKANVRKILGQKAIGLMDAVPPVV